MSSWQSNCLQAVLFGETGIATSMLHMCPPPKSDFEYEDFILFGHFEANLSGTVLCTV